MAAQWSQHTPKNKKLPEHVGETEAEVTKKGSDVMTTIAQLAKVSATDALVEKLAEVTQVTPELVRHLASTVRMAPDVFVKKAYANPDDYTTFLKLASGAMKPQALTKQAAGGKMVSSLLAALQTMGKKSITPSPGGNMLTRGLEQNALGGKTPLGRAALMGATGGTAGIVGNNMMSGGGQPPMPPAPEAAPSATPAPAATNGPAANTPPIPEAPAGGGAGGGGMSNIGKAALIGGGLGAGALGIRAALKKRKQKEVMAAALPVPQHALHILRQVFLTKAAGVIRNLAAKKFVHYLDKVAMKMPIEKCAQVRTMQQVIKGGQSLAQAIKVAYPQLTGEERGILAAKLCKAASDMGSVAKESISGAVNVEPRQAKVPFKVVGRQEGTAKVKGNKASAMMKKMSK